MIIEALVTLLRGVVEFLFGLLGDLPAPGWLTDLSGQMSGLVATGASMGVWVPWSVLGAGMAAVGTCLVVSLTVRVVRIVISLFTGGGGSAA